MTTPRKFRLALLTVLGLTLMAQTAVDPTTTPEATPDSPPPTPDASTPSTPTTDNTAPEDTTPPDDVTPAPANPLPPASMMATLPGGSNIAILPVRDMIYGFTLDSLERRVERAIHNGADLIVIEFDTPGGMLTTALDICKFLKDPQKVPVPTIAWIHPKAYSAGILIASACDEIVMSASSVTGDCAPIAPGQNLNPTERAKVLSPLLAEFRDNANRHGYDYAMFHAMCVLGVKLYVIENKETGERKVVNQADYSLMVLGAEPKAAGFVGSLFGRGSAGADPQQIDEVTREVATDADLGQWKAVETLPSGAFYANGMIHNGNTLFTPDQTVALDIGLSKATLSTDAQIKQHFSGASITRINQSWSENMAGFLTHPIVKGILVAVLLIGAYMEIQSPGFGVGGTVALIALIALLGAPFIIGLSDIWFVLVFVLGLVLLIVELLFTPSFGILGIVGIVFMLAGLIFSAVATTGGVGTLPIPPREMWDRLLQSSVWTVLGLGGGLLGIYFLTRYFGNVPMLNRLILNDQQHAYTAQTPEAPIAGHEVIGQGRIRVGDTGRVTTTGLRPTGQADIAGQVIDVVSQGAWIEPGRKVKVIEVHGNRIVVDPVDAPT